jgi:hypothetical protein
MRFLLAILLCFLAVGCRSDQRCQRQTALLRAEILDLEDKYYSLKAKHEANGGVVTNDTYYEGEVIYDGGVIQGEGSQSYNEGDVIYEGEVFYGSTDQYGNPLENGVILGAPETNGQVISTPLDSPGTIIDSQPAISSGSTRSGSSSVVEPRTEPQADPQSETLPTIEDSETPEELPVPNTNDQSGLQINSPGSPDSITDIQVNASSTRGRDIDGNPGDEGLDLLIQPITANGSIEHQAGELAVSLIDPAQTPDRQRVGLWKFLTDETKLFFANDQQGNKGILLHLPWDQSTPVNENLVLHIRFLTPDGRTLKTTSNIRINPPSPNYSPDDPLIAGWTQSDSRWEAPGSNSDAIAGSDWRQQINQQVIPPRRSSVPAIQASTSRSFNSRSRSNPREPAISKSPVEKPTWRPIR